MILVDFNQTLISNLMSQIGSNPNAELDENLIRHMVLSSILSYKQKFSTAYGELIFCTDDKRYWRKTVFPFYKANRKKMRDSSKFDWQLIFNTLNKIRDELKTQFPYRVIQADGAEADDVIGTLVKYSQTNELQQNGLDSEPQKVLIISGDKDFFQLQKYKNVTQFSPIQKKFVRSDDPKKVLLEHIMRGDSGDGIPNILSPDAVFITDGIRQTPIRSTKVQEWITLEDPEKYCDDNMLRNYSRNRILIDLDYIPNEIQEKIVTLYKEGPVGSRKNLLNYFIENRLKYLLDSISEF